jgi:hypothetical protein
MILPCTDCGDPCGSAADANTRVRCAGCQQAFDAIRSAGVSRPPDSARRVELYARRYERIRSAEWGRTPSVFEAMDGIG